LIKFFLILFLITTVYASDDKKASSIFNLIAKDITDKASPNIYLHISNPSLEKYPGDLNIVKTCDAADLVIISTVNYLPKECSKKILFGTRYSHLKNPNVIGAFFWQKGRPNILFYEKRLEKYSIKLEPSFNKYIEN